MITFADLSHHQATVDLPTYARQHDRVALKATEGLRYVDPRFADRWAEAGRLGLARIAYHFAKAINSGAAEFDHFWAVVGALDWTASDRLCLDSEDTQTPGRAAEHATEFTARAVTRGMPTGLFYTGRWYAQPNGLTASRLQFGWQQLWLADYTASHSDAALPLPSGWTAGQLCARQYTSTATVVGVTGGCDYSRVLIDWLATDVQEDLNMATLDDVLAELQGLRRDVSGLYRLGFMCQTPAGDYDPTHALGSIRQVNALLQQILDTLTETPAGE